MLAAADVLPWLAAHRGEAIVVCTMTTSRLWPAVSRRKELDLPVSNCMGKASSVALGIAMARPDATVWVLDGDGSLAMNLGALLSVAQLRPANFVHFVFQDGAYTTVGGSPVPGSDTADFAGMARAAGYAAAACFGAADHLHQELPALMAGPGPLLVCLRIDSWEGLGTYGPMSQEVMDRGLAAAADKFWALRQTLTGQGPGQRPPA